MWQWILGGIVGLWVINQVRMGQSLQTGVSQTLVGPAPAGQRFEGGPVSVGGATSGLISAPPAYTGNPGTGTSGGFMTLV